jgi:adenylosuccinate synthase
MALIPFSSQIIADLGISFGDEGKGRLVYEVIDELTESTGDEAAVQMVLKVNGGANSGHTAAGLKHNLLPCAVAAPGVPALAMGSGVVADPRKILWEARPLEAKGFAVVERLAIDERTMVSDLTHRLLDLAWEHYRRHTLGEPVRGTTGRGITPAYLEEAGQWQLGFEVFRGEKDAFARKMKERAARALGVIEHVCGVDPASYRRFFERLTEAEQRANAPAIDSGVFRAEEFDFLPFLPADGDGIALEIDHLIDVYWAAGKALQHRVQDVRERILNILASGRYVLGEFGQAFWLDKRHGYAPNVTASHTFTPELFESAGIPLQHVHAIGVCKAYDTKVGTHHFLTEMPSEHALGDRLRRIEYGTSTGRQRMVGWFDAVEKGDALRFGGFQDMAINKLDALTLGPDYSGPLKICTHYVDAGGERFPGVPRDDKIRTSLSPVYAALPGWDADISGIRSFGDLPENARRYVAEMVRSTLDVASRWAKDNIEAPNLRYLGVGPDPSQIIKDIPATATLLS